MSTPEIGIGSHVYTRDGDQLGRVKEIRSGFFKLDVPMAQDYWLRTDCVADSSADRITLNIDKGDLGGYKVENPDDYDTGVGQTADAMATIAASAMGTSDPLSEATLGAATVAAATGGMGGPVPEGWNEWAPRYRLEWERREGASGRRWEDVEAACCYGYTMSRDPRYQGREWADAERDLSISYPEWSRSAGYDAGDTDWDRMKNDARDAWHYARGGAAE